MSPTEVAHHSVHREDPQQRQSPAPHPPYSAFDTSPEASSSRGKGVPTDPTSQLQTFADERRYAVGLPKTEGEAANTAFSSYSSSPYTSPKTAPRQRTGEVAAVVAPMEEITLPPMQAAVPTRRGAVSGASSGPLMPFPPIRPPFEDDEFPSRGPSPTLGKRGSFSMGHSNHVPPGPDVQLPTPVLSGSSERRGGLMSIPSYMNGSHPQYHGEGSDGPRSSSNGVGPARLLEEGHGHYQPVAQRPAMNWPPYRPALPRSESGEGIAAPLSVFQSSSPPMNNASNAGIPARHGQFNDDTHRHYSHSHVRMPPQPFHTQTHPHPLEPQHRSTPSGSYHYDYNREGSAMSPGSSHSLLPGDSSMSPRTKQEQLNQEDHDSNDMESNGKRPRSAPRVMSTQPRIFACTQCPARFARNHDLKRHQRGHLSVRPYPCNWCDKSFSRKDALKRHILVKGCGKDGKGGGSGKGDGKGKRSRGEDSDKRSSHNHDSSGGDQEDGQYDIKAEYDGPKSEENQQHRGGNYQRAAGYDEGKPKDAMYSQMRDAGRTQTYSLDKHEYRGGRYSDTMSQFKGTPFGSGPGSLSNMAVLHGRRPSASVA